MIDFAVTIPGNPITKKNSQQIIQLPVKGQPDKKRPCIVPSAQYKRYEKACGYPLNMTRDFSVLRKIFPISEPVTVTVLYYMETKRKVDLPNLLEATDDVLVKYGILSDDNSEIVVSHDGSRVYYDKDNPRALIRIKSCNERSCKDASKGDVPLSPL